MAMTSQTEPNLGGATEACVDRNGSSFKAALGIEVKLSLCVRGPSTVSESAENWSQQHSAAPDFCLGCLPFSRYTGSQGKRRACARIRD